MSSRLPSGSPHFKGIYNQNRQSDYNLKKALFEFIDNPLYKCSSINIVTRVTNDRISQLIISDNYEHGFENMFETGVKNPFNMTHMRIGQHNDDETSQFGIGLKAGAISSADKLDVYTRIKVDDEYQYWRVEMDFPEMCEREEDSFSPNVYRIEKKEYDTKHPFKEGSTLVLSNMHHSIYEKTSLNDLNCYIQNEISKTYNDIIHGGIKIKVNGVLIEYQQELYDLPECKPFTENYKIYKYLINKEPKYFIKSTTTKSKWHYDEDSHTVKNLNQSDYENLLDKTPIQIGSMRGTFCMFVKDLEELPRGRTDIYRNGRCYGTWNPLCNDGNKNYSVSRIDIKSKEIAKQLGLTFNKNISGNQTNTEITAFKEFIKKITNHYNANISTKAYLKLYEIAVKNKLHIDENHIPSSLITETPTIQIVEHPRVIPVVESPTMPLPESSTIQIAEEPQVIPVVESSTIQIAEEPQVIPVVESSTIQIAEEPHVIPVVESSTIPVSESHPTYSKENFNKMLLSFLENSQYINYEDIRIKNAYEILRQCI